MSGWLKLGGRETERPRLILQRQKGDEQVRDGKEKC